jgi:myosin heavy subunit
MLEDQRDRRYNQYARVIQKAFKKYFARRQHDRQKEEAASKWHAGLFFTVLCLLREVSSSCSTH